MGNILVIDDKISYYDSFFDHTGWTKIEPEKMDGQWDERKIGEALAREYDVIIVEFDWLRKYEELFFNTFIHNNTPFVITARNNPQDGHNWATFRGASGYFPEGKFSPEPVRQEILRILECYVPSGTEYVGFQPVDSLQLMVTFLLRQNRVCFRHWSFFNQPAESVFEAEALAMMSGTTSAELEDVVRTSLIAAKEDNDAPMVSKKHLPKRFTTEIANTRKIELQNVTFARTRFQSIELLLADGNSIEYLEKTDPNLKADLRALRIEHHPSIDIRRSFTHVFRSFPFEVGIFYSANQTAAAQLFANKYLNILRHEFHINIYDYKILPPELINEIDILRQAKTIDAFFFFLCSDSIQPGFVGTEAIAKAFERQSKNHPVIFGLLMENCNWQLVFKNGEYQILPDSASPLSNMPDLNDVFTKINEEIMKKLLSIWPV